MIRPRKQKQNQRVRVTQSFFYNDFVGRTVIGTITIAVCIDAQVRGAGTEEGYIEEQVLDAQPRYYYKRAKGPRIRLMIRVASTVLKAPQENAGDVALVARHIVAIAEDDGTFDGGVASIFVKERHVSPQRNARLQTRSVTQHRSARFGRHFFFFLFLFFAFCQHWRHAKLVVELSWCLSDYH
jgi:hypothetical protein